MEQFEGKDTSTFDTLACERCAGLTSAITRYPASIASTSTSITQPVLPCQYQCTISQYYQYHYYPASIASTSTSINQPVLPVVPVPVQCTIGQYYQYHYYSVPSQHCQYNSIRRQYPRIPRNRDGNGFLIKDAMEAIIVGMSRALSIIGTPFRRRINQC